MFRGPTLESPREFEPIRRVQGNELSRDIGVEHKYLSTLLGYDFRRTLTESLDHVLHGEDSATERIRRVILYILDFSRLIKFGGDRNLSWGFPSVSSPVEFISSALEFFLHRQFLSGDLHSRRCCILFRRVIGARFVQIGLSLEESPQIIINPRSQHQSSKCVDQGSRCCEIPHDSQESSK